MDALSPAMTDAREVAALDIEYQAAVKRNDAETMARILHPDFQLVLGDGRMLDREDLLDEARSGIFDYEIQDEEAGSQSVMVVSDTALVTAKLRLKGRKAGEAFDRTLWFTDTYIRTAAGWRYLYAQASLPLPQA